MRLYLDNYNSDYKQDYYNLFMGYYNLGRLDLIQIIKVYGEINRFKPKNWSMIAIESFCR